MIQKKENTHTHTHTHRLNESFLCVVIEFFLVMIFLSIGAKVT